MSPLNTQIKSTKRPPHSIILQETNYWGKREAALYSYEESWIPLVELYGFKIQKDLLIELYNAYDVAQRVKWDQCLQWFLFASSWMSRYGSVCSSLYGSRWGLWITTIHLHSKNPSRKFPGFEFVDPNGVVVKVRKLVLEVLKYAMRRGFIVSTLSWNDPAKALQALRTLDPGKLLHFHAIEDRPNKALTA
jgi:hypothetical protein